MTYASFNRGIPDEAHQQLGILGPRGIAAFAFTHTGGWVIVTKDRAIYARGIPDDCYKALGVSMNAGDDLRALAFAPSGGWVFVTNRGHVASGIPDECFTTLGAMLSAGAHVTCIAFPPSGGNRWVILAGAGLNARGINDACYQLLCNCLPSTRPARTVAFTPQGGYAILAEDYYWGGGIPDECMAQLNAFHTGGFIVDHVVFAPSGGWSVLSNTKIPPRAADTIRSIENNIVQESGQAKSIWDRMTKYHTPGVSVAVVLNNRVAWATTYGRLEQGKDEFVYADSVFQAASISKVVSALGFLHQVQDNRIGIDENVNPKLSWTLPVCSGAQSSWKSGVTLRRLLQHRAGISGLGAPNLGSSCNNYGGFNGYANTSGVSVPTLTQVLNGTSPANSSPIQLTHQPNTGQFYSGPSYVVLMKLLEDLTGSDFRTWMRDNILVPTGMSRSTFDMTLPATLARAAAGHDASGNVISGKRNRYPEASAAGLYTTPSDLCRFIMLLNLRGRVGRRVVLDQTRADMMVNEATGIFTVGAPTANNFFYWHNGGNRGFKCLLKGFPNRQAGVVVMTNGDAGDTLHNEVVQAVETAYGWG